MLLKINSLMVALLLLSACFPQEERPSSYQFKAADSVFEMSAEYFERVPSRDPEEGIAAGLLFDVRNLGPLKQDKFERKNENRLRVAVLKRPISPTIDDLTYWSNITGPKKGAHYSESADKHYESMDLEDLNYVASNHVQDYFLSKNKRLLVACNAFKVTLPNPGCRGTLRSEKLNILIRLYFRKKKLSEFSKVSDQFEDFFIEHVINTEVSK